MARNLQTRLRSALLAACATFTLAAPAVAAPGPAGLTPAELDSLVARTMQAFQVPGLAVGVVKDGQVVFAKGYGVRRLGEAATVDPDTIFSIGSNSKAFTTAALAMLVDEKKLKWDDKVIDYLPDFRMYDPYVTREMTVRDLVTHRSGLPSYAGDLVFVPSSDFTRKEIIGALRHLKPATSFRTRYAYDNLLYVAAGEVVPAASGQSWEDFVQGRILKKLGMEPCAVTPQRLSDRRNVATPHAPVNDRMQPIAPDNLEVVGAAGSIQCNITGMAKWVNLMLAEGALPSGERLLSQKQALELTSPQTLLPVDREGLGAQAGMRFQSYALGWGVSDFRGWTLVQHDGSVSGMNSMVAMLPQQKFGVIVLTNQPDDSAKIALILQMLDAQLGHSDNDWVTLLKTAKDEDRQEVASIERDIAKAVRSAGGKATLPLKAYAGDYRDPWRGDVAVRLDGDHLTMKFSRTKDLEGRLYAYSGDVFVVRWNERSLDADAFVRFTPDFERGIEGMTMRAISPATDPSFDFKDLSFKKLK